MSDSSTSWSACTISATRAARRSLSPKRISAVATRVVLVDHRDAAERQQGGERRARVEVAAPVLGVLERQQQLGGGQAVRRQRLGPGLRQPDLPDRGGGLLLLEPQPRLQPGRARAGRGRWRRTRRRSPRCRARGRRRCRPPRRPARPARGAAVVHHQRAADLDHQQPRVAMRRGVMPARSVAGAVRRAPGPSARAAPPARPRRWRRTAA